MRLLPLLFFARVCGLGLAVGLASLSAQDAAKKEHPANRLAKENSPYLQQHAHNPVDWYPWGDEAFAASRESGKPIFLSIGYATCHWCHVMERESFEDEKIAAYLNEHFICIKVDREERPDIDQIYMNYQVAASGSGGWPLNVWLTPDLAPFVAGTYFPPEDKLGRPGFLTVLGRINEAWAEKSEDIIKGSAETIQQLEEYFSGAAKPGAGVPQPGMHSLETAYGKLASTYDRSFGGFGEAPKFPQPVQLDFLLQYSLDDVHPEPNRARALKMATATLENLAAGGIHDQVGGGFHRYSVDRIWRVPHFEKMLYDQAQLAPAFLDAYLATGDRAHADTARGIFDYVERRLTSEGGGFFSAEDADSYEREGDDEKKEGAFFVWTYEEVMELFGSDDAEGDGAIVCSAFGVLADGNAPPEGDPHGELKGRNVLYRAATATQLAEVHDRTPEQIEQLITVAKSRLFVARGENRIRPIRDDKVLTSWNGMMISAFARGYQALGEQRYLDRAHGAADFVLENLYDDATGRLLRSWREGPSDIDAFAEDYAFLVEALIDLYECDFRPERLAMAVKLQEAMIEKFADTEKGGFFDAMESPDLIMRVKSQDDGTMTSPNSTAARNLVRLSKMLGRKDFEEFAIKTVESANGLVERSPEAALKLLDVVRILESGGIQLVVAGKAGDPGVRSIVEQIHRRPQRNRVVLFADGGEGQALLAKDNEATAAMLPIQDAATLYLCIDFACRRPTSDAAKIAEQFAEVLGPAPVLLK